MMNSGGHGGGGGHVDDGVHQILRGVGAQAGITINGSNDECYWIQAARAGTPFQFSSTVFLPRCRLAEFRREKIFTGRRPTSAGVNGGEDQPDQAVIRIGGQDHEWAASPSNTCKSSHPGVFQESLWTKDVDQQRCDGVEHADKDPGDDDHLHEGFGAPFTSLT